MKVRRELVDVEIFTGHAGTITNLLQTYGKNDFCHPQRKGLAVKVVECSEAYFVGNPDSVPHRRVHEMNTKKTSCIPFHFPKVLVLRYHGVDLLV